MKTGFILLLPIKEKNLEIVYPQLWLNLLARLELIPKFIIEMASIKIYLIRWKKSIRESLIFRVEKPDFS